MHCRLTSWNCCTTVTGEARQRLSSRCCRARLDSQQDIFQLIVPCSSRASSGEAQPLAQPVPAHATAGLTICYKAK